MVASFNEGKIMDLQTICNDVLTSSVLTSSVP